VRGRIGAWVAAILLAAPVAAFAQGETIAEIRVHGNYTTPDGDVLALSGLRAGEPATDARLAAARKALADSDRFDDVEVLKRFRSIDDPTDILVMIVVRASRRDRRSHAGRVYAVSRAAVDADSQLRRRLRPDLRARTTHSGWAARTRLSIPLRGW
jgi:hypothetical protein